MATSFTDTKGRAWSIDVTVDAIKRVRSLLSIDLLEICGGGNLLERLVDDPVQMVDVVCAVLRPALAAAGVADDDFGAAMGGDAIDAATAAFLESLVAFFPRPKRVILENALRKLTRLQELTAETATARLDAALPELEATIRKRVGEASIDWPASSGSTPGH